MKLVELNQETVEKWCKENGYILSVDQMFVAREILQKVSSMTGMSIPTIRRNTREGEIIEVRQLVHYVIKEKTLLSLSAIGSLVGKRDHATVISSIKRISDLLLFDKMFRKKYDKIITFYGL